MENIESTSPIYRAVSLDIGEEIEGYMFKTDNGCFIIEDCDYNRGIEEGDMIKVFFKVDPTTLAIHFPNMLAKATNRFLVNGEEDLRIFASLNPNGKGGDLCTYISGHIVYEEADCVSKFVKGASYFVNLHNGKYCGVIEKDWAKNFKILGIQK